MKSRDARAIALSVTAGLVLLSTLLLFTRNLAVAVGAAVVFELLLLSRPRVSRALLRLRGRRLKRVSYFDHRWS